MRCELTTHNGIPTWRYDDGTVLPVIAGGQEDADQRALEALAILLGGGLKEEPLPSGTTLYGTDGQYAGQLIMVGDQLKIITPGGGLAPQPFTGGTYMVDAGGGKIWHVMLDKGGSILEKSTSTAPTPTPGSTYHPPAWKPGELALEQQGLQIDRDRLQAEIAQTEAQLAWDKNEFAKAEAGRNERAMAQIKADMDMLELRLDNSRRELMVTEGGAMARTVTQEKGAMQRKLLDLGPDPSKQAAHILGQAQTGVTPQQVAVGQAQSFINQPVPQMHFGMNNQQMAAALATLQGIQPPQFGGFGMAPGAFSMAEGGLIEMEKGTDGAFSVKPSQRESYFVGDGAGIVPGVTEVLTVEKGPFGIKSVEVTPLAGAAQGGLQLNTLQGLAPLFGPFGPTFARPAGGVAGQMGEIVTTNFGALSGLGITPQWVREIETGKVYGIEGNIRRYISNPEVMGELGVNPSSIINAYASEIARIAPTEGPPVYTSSGYPSPASAYPPAFQAAGSPLIHAASGAILPEPFKRAGQLGQWQRENPALYNLALSAYGSALDPFGNPYGGLSPGYVQAQTKAGTPQSRGGYAGWNPPRIGFTGAR